MYFGRSVEEAIVEYNNSNSKVHRELVFTSTIYPALAKLVENVIHNRKFYEYGADDYSNVKHDCICYLHERLNKYSFEKGKAFSYFNRITINWVFAFMNKLNKERTLFPTFHSDDDDERPSIHEIDRRRDLDREAAEEEYQIELTDFVEKWSAWGNDNLDNFFFVKDNKIVPFTLKDKQIANAVFDLFKQCHRIDNYNKKALYICIREQVDCKTQSITDVVNVLKLLYKGMYFEFKRSGTRYWHRFLYYPEGIGELTDEKLGEMIYEDRCGDLQEE